MNTPVLIYCCSSGGSKFHDIAVELGFRYGMRLPDSQFRVHSLPYFADQNFKKPDRVAYITALAKYRPEVATVLDWEKPNQYNEVMSWASEAALYCNKVVIIPKVPGTVKNIPKRVGKAKVLIGYSIPTKYGGTRVSPEECVGKSVHLLGGSPHRQMEYSLLMDVESTDGNMAHKLAHRGLFWSALPGKSGHWISIKDTGIKIDKDANSEAFRLSCTNIVKAWKIWTSNPPKLDVGIFGPCADQKLVSNYFRRVEFSKF